MAIDHRDEGQTRLEWMISEFQDARRRRLVKPSQPTVELDPDSDPDTKAAVIGPEASRKARAFAGGPFLVQA